MRSPALFAVLVTAVLALPACSSTQDVLEPSALAAETAAPQAEFPLTPPSQPSSGQATAVVTDARVQFASVVGAPGQASAPLSSRLTAQAGTRGITLVESGGASATHVMKGYFSAIAEPNETTVIYVWDVVDPNGNRVHRIQGQAKSPGGSGDGWSSVQPATMEAIADQTMSQLAAWLVSQQG